MANITIQAPVVNIYSVEPEWTAAVLSKLTQVLERIDTMSPQFQALVDQVAANTSVTNSAIALLQGLNARLDELAQSGASPEEIAAVSADLRASTESLAAAIVENTPAAPPSGAPTA